MFKHILVPLDGSERSEQAIPYAVEIASPDTTITLLHVMEIPITPFPISPSPPALPRETEDYDLSRARKQDAAHKYLEKTAQSIAAEATQIEMGIIVGSNPADKILSYVEEHGVDSIVMATRGHSGIARWLMGSVTEKVLQAAECPVLVVPAK